MLAMLLAAAPAAAQQYPPCAPGVVPADMTLHGRDLEDGGGSLTATHTISLELESASTGDFVDEFSLALPPGARKRSAGGPAFSIDTPGPVTVAASWEEFEPSSGEPCTASTQGTFQIEAAKPLRFVPPRRSARLMTELEWRVRIGKDADLRPIEARLRGVRRARLPRASAPLKTMALNIRRGDGRRLPDVGRVLRSAGWRFRFAPSYPEAGFEIRMSDFKRRGGGRRFGFGIDLELVQGDRQIGRTRARGRCEFSSVGGLCRYTSTSTSG